MDLRNEKCAIIIDSRLPLGVIANTAAILGITLGKNAPETVGNDICDKTEKRHLGIIEFPVPVLKADAQTMKDIRQKLFEKDFSDITAVDFSDLAQGCKTYDEYTEKMKNTPESALTYFGLAILGEKKKVNKLTGSLPLLR